MYIERILDEVEFLGIPNPRWFIPCSKEEIVQLEQQTHLSLPRAYREFLLTMGHNADHILADAD